MQNKGFVKVIAVLLTLICIFYLSFSLFTTCKEREYEELKATDSIAAEALMDSLNTNKCYLWSYTLKECRENAIGLGLDLKGGMNVVMEVSVPDVVKALADTNSQDPAFNQAINEAKKESQESQSDFISLFIEKYKKASNGGNLSAIFANNKLAEKVKTNSSDKDVEKVLRAEVDAAIDNSFQVLRTRIDRFGVVQPNIQKIEGQSGRISVELPGVKEPERVRKLLQGSANLEFWETYTTQEALPYLQQLDNALRGTDTAAADTTAAGSTKKADKPEVAKAETKDTAKADSANNDKAVAKADTAKKDTSKNILSQVDKANKDGKDEKISKEQEEQFKKEHPLFAIFQAAQGNAGCMVGYALAKDTAEINRMVTSPQAKNILPPDLSLKWGVKAMDKAGKLFELYAIKETGNNGKAPLEGEVITDAKESFDEYGKPCVSMSMNTEGARKWATLTEANVGRAVAIVLDNYVYSAPNVNGKIDGGNSQITGNFTTNDTKDLSTVLSSGKMPAPTQIVQEDIVGPSLGQESINAGLISFIIAFVILMVYMCMMYGIRPGMVANGALIINFFFTLGILTSFQAALTMSGIAGMVLTLGTAVDANVLINERIKEELRGGKTMKSAIAAGYSNAFSAIFDSNLTSLITGIILFSYGTGPIRGFATTLMIGIVCSFFTAVWLTRIVFEHFVNRDKWLDITFTTSVSKNLMQGTKYKFMSSYKKSFTIFAILIVAGVASLVIRGLSQSIDFTGGRNFKVEFTQPVSVENLRSALQDKLKDPEGKEAVNTNVIALGTDGKSIRVTTNYKIKDNDVSVDQEIEEILFNTFKEQNVLAKNIDLNAFIDRDNRTGGSIISSQKVGPSIAEDITYGAFVSVILAMIAIFLYILLRFRNVAYSVGSIVALAVDTFMIMALYSICYGWIGFSLEIDQTFIGAILTAIGYSINDKVVVFDRIRENFKLYPKRDRQRLFNDSLNQTLARTVNTSVSTLIVLVSIFVFGGDSIRSFAFAMILGVIFGTLSSLFIAAPTAYLVMGGKIKEAPAEENEETVTKK